MYYSRNANYVSDATLTEINGKAVTDFSYANSGLRSGKCG